MIITTIIMHNDNYKYICSLRRILIYLPAFCEATTLSFPKFLDLFFNSFFKRSSMSRWLTYLAELKSTNTG